MNAAGGTIVDVNDTQARDQLLGYAKAQFPTADRVRLLEDEFSSEIVGRVELKFHGVRVVAGISRPLWDHSDNFEDLRAHMEKYRWRDTVNSVKPPKLRVLLGDHGWAEWK